MNCQTETEKSELRKIIKSKRAVLPIEQYSSVICEKLKETHYYKKSKDILIYSSIFSEINTGYIISDTSKIFYLPRINGLELDICRYSDEKHCSKNLFGISEPTSNPIYDYSIIDLAIVPALCADKEGYRLGYGKGFYDRFLPKLKSDCKKIILLPDEVLLNSIPHDNFDIKCDIIITQRNIIFI